MQQPAVAPAGKAKLGFTGQGSIQPRAAGQRRDLLVRLLQAVGRLTAAELLRRPGGQPIERRNAFARREAGHDQLVDAPRELVDGGRRRHTLVGEQPSHRADLALAGGKQQRPQVHAIAKRNGQALVGSQWVERSRHDRTLV
jgi:hypothetical protein